MYQEIEHKSTMEELKLERSKGISSITKGEKRQNG
jgi:hypothetical protein